MHIIFQDISYFTGFNFPFTTNNTKFFFFPESSDVLGIKLLNFKKHYQAKKMRRWILKQKAIYTPNFLPYHQEHSEVTAIYTGWERLRI